VIGIHRVRRDRHGRYRLTLSKPERNLLRSLPEQAKEVLHESEPTAARLYPPAYPGDDEANAEYRRMAGASLLDRHRRALDTIVETVDDSTLDEAQLHEWLDGLEVLRLVLGTQLDVSEDMDEIETTDPRAPHFAVYGYLSMLQAEFVDALSQGLPDAGTGAQPPDVDALDDLFDDDGSGEPER
jgi:Domain of unknown function (DUF2017)